MSEVFGVRLDDGREIAVKARASDARRVGACIHFQNRAAAAGLPCAAPLTGATEQDGLTIHAEEWRPGGSMRHDDGQQHAAESAQVLAAVMQVTLAADVPATFLMPNPVWVDWEHSETSAWP